jgi:hypothetical protein
MIKKWAEFIKEDLDMDNKSYLDSRMQIKDMLEGTWRDADI